MSDDFMRDIGNPRTWARTLLLHAPDQVSYLNEREFGEATFGAWLKRGLRAEEEARTLAMLEESWNAPDAPEPDAADDEGTV